MPRDRTVHATMRQLWSHREQVCHIPALVPAFVAALVGANSARHAWMTDCAPLALQRAIGGWCTAGAAVLAQVIVFMRKEHDLRWPPATHRCMWRASDIKSTCVHAKRLSDLKGPLDAEVRTAAQCRHQGRFHVLQATVQADTAAIVHHALLGGNSLRQIADGTNQRLLRWIGTWW